MANQGTLLSITETAVAAAITITATAHPISVTMMAPLTSPTRLQNQERLFPCRSIAKPREFPL